MAKAPVAGAVKTRLAREVGVPAATRLARQATAALVGRVGCDARWQTTLWVSPDAAASARHWPRGIAHRPQGPGDLGRRMQRILKRAEPGPVVIIGTDIPGITPALVAEAFALLGRHDVVLGPAEDGGYWLIGARRRPRLPRPFAGVRWSSPDALADTVANLTGLSVAYVATLRDVDDAAALRACAGFGRRVR